MIRPKREDFKPQYRRGEAELCSATNQYSLAQDRYIDFLEGIHKMFKSYGTKDTGPIIFINEDKLTKDFIEQIRNYLNSIEKKTRKKK
jgi:hypothetical protein